MEKIIVITKEDFDNFKNELLTEIKSLFESNIKKQQWIRSKDVREMLGISDAKLQNMRINKTIPAYYLDGTWFYKYEEIVEVMEKNKLK
ncbi:MAG TPA: helix-turn-helix domain-containing protein [Prolixibacteraceae bacterium]|nr:helix-turn-helix domain-containing protein [Prolixibacteraceae bacterium]